MIKQILLGGLVAVLGAILCNVLWFLDLNKRVYNHKPGKCRLVDGPLDGSEDIEYIESEGLAFITSGIFYMHPRPGVEGKIFLYDFKNPAAKYQTKELKIIGKPGNFQAHGITSWVDEKGEIRLYVVSHHSPQFTHSIEAFDFNKKDQTLKHVKTFTHQNFIRPNDLHAVGKDKFVFTNDGTAQTGGMNALEMFMGLKAGSVGYFDGKDAHWLVEADRSPNGIWVDRKRNTLFYASPNGEFIRVMKLSDDFKSVTPITQVDLLTSPDNLYMDKNGDLWTAGHPVMSKLTNLDACSHRPAPGTERGPSQVLRISFSKDYQTHEVTEPYTDDGRELCCSSVAVHDSKGNMLIGSVAAELLHCEYMVETI
ncbi:unnamed protein product, partial [Mesorhabditis belari]|uniref:Arylesterase n=1 Tax=Mesorhabditis belari TaxID=2138241 RepID=A0AAF3EDE6_9BILA